MSYLTYTHADLTFPDLTAQFVTGINDQGQVVGHYRAAASSEIGFLYSGGTYTAVSYPSLGYQNDRLVSDHAWITRPGAINDSGAIVGTYTPAHSIYPVFLYSGIYPVFLYSGGSYTTLESLGAFGLLVRRESPVSASCRRPLAPVPCSPQPGL